MLTLSCRATYRFASKLNRNLPPALPSSGIEWNSEDRADKGIKDFAKWAAAWREIKSPVRRGYQLANLLTGGRPGELSRLTWDDVDLKARTLTLRNVKSRSQKRRDILLPLSRPLIQCFRLAGTRDGVVFPSARHNPGRDKLPATGMALRRAFQSIAVGLNVDPVLRKVLMGHKLGSDDVTEGYALSAMFRFASRQAQAEVSAEILRKLGVKL